MSLNKKYIDIFVISITAFICFLFLKNNLYMPLSDFGRELFIPSEIIQGKILYKDIFNLYAPLGYILNAIVIKIFGNSFNVFYYIGFILSLFSLMAIYKISKLFTNRILSFLITVFIIFSCTFYPSISNWITPYSYSIMYALTSILWALYFLIKYTQNDNKIYLYFSALLYGFSISSKYEYFLFIFAIIITCFYKKTNIKTLLISVIFAILIPLITCITLIFQGIEINNIVQSVLYSISLAKSHAANFFYEYSGIKINAYTLKNILISLIKPHFVSMFYSMTFICFIILFLNKKSEFKLILLNITALLLSFKVIGGINFEIYGTYFFPVLFISLIAFLFYKKINLTFLNCFIIVLILCYSVFIFKNNNFIEINTEKGNIKILKEFEEPIVKMNEFISKTEKTDKILILPEGVFLNWLTERSTNDYIFYLIPPHSEILTDEYVIKEIENGNYKYIAVSNIMYPWFNQTSYSKSWGKEVVDYIKLKYEKKQIIGEKLKFYIYEKK